MSDRGARSHSLVGQPKLHGRRTGEPVSQLLSLRRQVLVGLGAVNPAALIRIAGDLYPVNLSRVEVPSRLDHAWRTRAAKTGMGVDRQRPNHWWSFAVTSR